MNTTTDRSELLAQLSEGIAKLTTSEEWQRHLDCQSRFYSYRTGRSGVFQRGECLQRHEAMHVAGFNAWRKHGRFVRKGEKAILPNYAKARKRAQCTAKAAVQRDAHTAHDGRN